MSASATPPATVQDAQASGPGRQQSTRPPVAPVEHLDGMRALAALFVVAHHAWLTVYPLNLGVVPQGWMWRLTGALAFGHFAVTAFIVISGYSLGLAVARDGTRLRDPLRFLLRRARRIVPPYWAALGLSAALTVAWLDDTPTGTHFDHVLPVDPAALVRGALLLQDLVRTPLPNVAFWSIAVEWHLYLWLPVIVLVLRKLGLVAGATLVVVLAFAGTELTSGTEWARTSLQLYGAFTLGLVAALALHARRDRLVGVAWWALALACALLVAVPCALWPVATTFSRLHHLDWAAAGAVTCLLMALELGQIPRVRRVLCGHALRWAGHRSYSIYLMHSPLLQAGWLLSAATFGVASPVALLVMLAVVSPVVIGLCCAFYCVAERPFLTSAARARADAVRR